jgi:hypothetical protein
VRSDRDLDAILEQCLAQIAAGKARVESCLLAYPAYADELEPLLRAAERMWALPTPELAPEAKARIEAQVLRVAPRGPLTRASRRAVARPRFVMPKFGWALGAMAALLLLAVVSVSLVQASASALPGMALYPVKLAVEDFRLWLAPAEDEPALHLEFARRRLAEIEALAEQGRSDPDVVADMTAHMQAALSGAEQLPPQAAGPVLEALIALTEVQERTLPELAERVLPSQRQALRRAVGTSAAFAARARILLGLELPEPGASATPTATSTSTTIVTATSEPGAVSTLAAEPTWTSTPTATPSPVPPTGTVPPSPTPVPFREEPTATWTREPTPVPTDVPPESTEPPPEPTDPPPESTAEPTKEKNTPPAWGKTPEPWPPPTQHVSATPKP